MMFQAQILLNKDEMDAQGHPLYLTLLQWLVAHHIAQASVFEGISGIGNHRIIQPGALFSFDEPPVVILFEEEAEKVRATLRKIRLFSPRIQIIAYPIEIF